ncbi:MAG TPA: hypothetical protein VNA12_11070 [Mycobacteriales bacterium]|nr:hypothetical protein [Mycobacteriales bacterium]
MPGTMRFCPSCGSPGAVTTETRAIELDPAPEPYPAEPPAAAPTTVLAGSSAAPSGPSASDRMAPAADAARERARELAGRFGSAPLEVRLALVGAVVTVLSFLLLPYADGVGRPVEISGRLWWLPIAAVAAAALLASTLRGLRRRSTQPADEVPRHTDALLAAVVVATAGVIEAGLLRLVTNDVVRPRAGFYGMLIGLVLVVVAAVRAARRRLR